MARRSDDDFRDEIESHIRLEADQLIEEGVEPSEALARARRRFGNVTSSQEHFYESSRAMWLENLLRDVRLSLREMRRSPVSTLVIVLSLALGIGASTSIFSLAHQAFVRQLPVQEPERIVQLHWDGHFVGGGVGSGSLLTHPFFRDLRAEQDVFVDLFARAQTEALLLTEDEAELVQAELVSGSYFPALGLRPEAGRLLDESDDRTEGAHPELVLSYDFWRRRFGAAPNVVGSRVRINDLPMTVVGVAPPGFRGTDWGYASDVFVSLAMMPQVMPWPAPESRRERSLHVFARLPEDLDAARAEVRLQPWFDGYIRDDIAREGWPSVTERQMERYLASTLRLLPGGRGQASLEDAMRRPLLILSVAAGLCLLLACLNVANLSLARTLAARRATAMRTALGASRAASCHDSSSRARPSPSRASLWASCSRLSSARPSSPICCRPARSGSAPRRGSKPRCWSSRCSSPRSPPSCRVRPPRGTPRRCAPSPPSRRAPARSLPDSARVAGSSSPSSPSRSSCSSVRGCSRGRSPRFARKAPASPRPTS